MLYAQRSVFVSKSRLAILQFTSLALFYLGERRNPNIKIFSDHNESYEHEFLFFRNVEFKIKYMGTGVVVIFFCFSRTTDFLSGLYDIVVIEKQTYTHRAYL